MKNLYTKPVTLANLKIIDIEKLTLFLLIKFMLFLNEINILLALLLPDGCSSSKFWKGLYLSLIQSNIICDTLFFDNFFVWSRHWVKLSVFRIKQWCIQNVLIMVSYSY